MQELLVSLWREAQATVFFVTHSIEEAVFLGDRIYLFSNAPGTIIEQCYAPRPDRPAVDAQALPVFTERVQYIRAKIAKMESDAGVI